MAESSPPVMSFEPQPPTGRPISHHPCHRTSHPSTIAKTITFISYQAPAPILAMKSSTRTALLLCLSSLVSGVISFAPAIQRRLVRGVLSAPAADTAMTTTYAFYEYSTALSMAGFGAASSSSTSKKQDKKGSGSSKQLVPKLRPKSQWDRYLDMKQCKKITVGVRIRGDDESSSDNNNWMEVGRVRSESDEHLEVAVARQRALIAEHGKRLYPMKIPPNAVLEWGYLNGEEEGDEEKKEWLTVDKSKGDDAPDGIEKKIGFEGISHPPTGYYCFYNQGRIVEKEDEGKFNRGSEKI